MSVIYLIYWYDKLQFQNYYRRICHMFQCWAPYKYSYIQHLNKNI